MNLTDYIQDCLNKRLLFFTGKGGVGKTTLAWATALLCAKKGKKVTLASWNPFDSFTQEGLHTLKDIKWMPIETLSAFKEYVLLVVKFEKLYDTVFNHPLIKTFVQAAPGLSETVVAGKIWNTYDSGYQDLLIVDLPSSGHALSFFQSPMGVNEIFKMGFVHRETEKICQMFTAEDTRIDLVALTEELPLVECLELKKNLLKIYPFHFGYLHLNQCPVDFQLSSPPQLSDLNPNQKCLLELYESQRNQLEESLQFAQNFDLPLLQVPKMATNNSLETVTQLVETWLKTSKN